MSDNAKIAISLTGMALFVGGMFGKFTDSFSAGFTCFLVLEIAQFTLVGIAMLVANPRWNYHTMLLQEKQLMEDISAMDRMLWVEEGRNLRAQWRREEDDDRAARHEAAAEDRAQRIITARGPATMYDNRQLHLHWYES